jgi:adenylate cyclase
VVDSPVADILVEFGSFVDAVECAVKIQEALKAKDAEAPVNRRRGFRIGVNLGDCCQGARSTYSGPRAVTKGPAVS